MKKLLIITCLLASCVLFLEGCKKKCHDKTNPDCENYDPCYGKKVTSAQFVIEELLLDDWNGKEIWIESDTFYGGNNTSKVRFRALSDADSFIWKIGAETLHSKSFIKNSFPSELRETFSLIVINKKPNRNCFPQDDGRDTSVHKIYTWPEQYYWDVNSKKYVFTNPTPTQGYYKGYYKSLPNSEVVIRLYDSNLYCFAVTSVDKSNGYLANIPNGYSTFKDCQFAQSNPTGRIPFGCVFAGLRKPNDSNSKITTVRVRGIALLGKDRKSIHIEMGWQDFTQPWTGQSWKDEFNGIKIK